MSLSFSWCFMTGRSGPHGLITHGSALGSPQGEKLGGGKHVLCLLLLNQEALLSGGMNPPRVPSWICLLLQNLQKEPCLCMFNSQQRSRNMLDYSFDSWILAKKTRWEGKCLYSTVIHSLSDYTRSWNIYLFPLKLRLCESGFMTTSENMGGWSVAIPGKCLQRMRPTGGISHPWFHLSGLSWGFPPPPQTLCIQFAPLKHKIQFSCVIS